MNGRFNHHLRTQLNCRPVSNALQLKPTPSVEYLDMVRFGTVNFSGEQSPEADILTCYSLQDLFDINPATPYRDQNLSDHNIFLLLTHNRHSGFIETGGRGVDIQSFLSSCIPVFWRLRAYCWLNNLIRNNSEPNVYQGVEALYYTHYTKHLPLRRDKLK